MKQIRAAEIGAEGIGKSFGSFAALTDVSLTIGRGEFLTLLGPSGSGKTTFLMILAGFEAATRGRLSLDGADMTLTPAEARAFGMVFQGYALFPHMTVAKNVGYGLKHEPMTPAQRADRVREMLDLVQLSEFSARKPHQISGGQRQRVALARALARQPKLLLLDEPLAALDKKLREATQFELMSIQERTGVTFIVVTHDQEEAMTLADRMAVMDKGIVRQVGRPAEIYEHPASRFVAGFIGSVTLFDAVVAEVSGEMAVLDVPAFGTRITAKALPDMAKGEAISLAIRPEKIELGRSKPTGPNTIAGEVKDLAYFGKDSLYRITLPSGGLISVHAVNAHRGEEYRPDWEEKVWLSFEPASAILLRE